MMTSKLQAWALMGPSTRGPPLWTFERPPVRAWNRLAGTTHFWIAILGHWDYVSHTDNNNWGLSVRCPVFQRGLANRAQRMAFRE